MTDTCIEVKKLRLIDLHPNCGGVVVRIFGYVVPSLAIVVTIVNILIITVFTRPHIRSHTTFLLTLIACVDILNIACPTVQYLYHYTFGRYEEYLSYVQCIATYILADIMVDFFNMISLWLTVLLAFLRCKCLTSPFVAHMVHDRKQLIVYLSGILTLALCIHVPSFFLFDFVPITVMDYASNSTTEVCGLGEARSSILKPCSKRKLHVLIKTVIDSLVPCMLLVYFNVVMLIILRKAKIARSSLRSRGSIAHETKKPATETSINDDIKDENVPPKNNHDQLKAKPGSQQVNVRSIWSKTKSQCFTRCFKRKDPEKTSRIANSALDRLNKECRRTSWLILMVSTIIVVHEIPLSIANVYALATHTDVPLPINIFGCFSAILLLWQYITYPVIFLIYSCMSGAFRTEICYIMTCNFIRRREPPPNKMVFMSPCSVRKSFSRRHHSSPRISLDALYEIK